MLKWSELFEKDSPKLISKVSGIYDKAYQQARVDKHVDDIGADETADKLEMLLLKDLRNENLINNSGYEKFHAKVDEWLPDLPPGEGQFKCATFQRVMLTALGSERQRQLLELAKYYRSTCEDYLAILDKNVVSSDKDLRSGLKNHVMNLAVIVKPPHNNATDQINNFHQYLSDNREAFKKKSNDSSIKIFIKALGAIATAIVSGNLVPYFKLFKDKNTRDQFLQKVSNKKLPTPKK